MQQASKFFQRLSAEHFVNFCISKFRWSDLSKDVIMEVGCGEDAFVSKVILEKFPQVRRIVAIDKSPNAVRMVGSNPAEKLECIVADIEKRASVQRYEGKITKVASANCFQQLMAKEMAFQNVYHLLQPNGEAAIVFKTKSPERKWAAEMIKKPKWREIFKGDIITDLFYEEFGALHYQNLVQKIGFQVVHCIEEDVGISFSSNEYCSEILCSFADVFFKVPPESRDEFKEDSLQSFLKVTNKDKDGAPRFETMLFHLLLVKPPA